MRISLYIADIYENCIFSRYEDKGCRIRKEMCAKDFQLFIRNRFLISLYNVRLLNVKFM